MICGVLGRVCVCGCVCCVCVCAVRGVSRVGWIRQALTDSIAHEADFVDDHSEVVSVGADLLESQSVVAGSPAQHQSVLRRRRLVVPLRGDQLSVPVNLQNVAVVVRALHLLVESQVAVARVRQDDDLLEMAVLSDASLHVDGLAMSEPDVIQEIEVLASPPGRHSVNVPTPWGHRLLERPASNVVRCAALAETERRKNQQSF